jgi:O-acetyl-ADP-ribose deacetylase (regulator of RNase III)
MMPRAFPLAVVRANLWDLHAQGCYIVNPTNMGVRANGRAIMGAGIAREVRDRFPGFDAAYGAHLLTVVRPGRPAGQPVLVTDVRKPLLWVSDVERIISLPTKVNHYEAARRSLITLGLAELADWANVNPDAAVALPRIGTGRGGLDWTDVRPLVEVFAALLSDHRQVTLVEF